MSRSKWKGPFIHHTFLRKNIFEHELFIIWARNSIVLSHFIGYKFLIHSGYKFKRCHITREKVGYKFGEFCTTRARCYHRAPTGQIKKKSSFKIKKKRYGK